LFDEIEKAHQDVFNILLQILDDGRLTDGKGRTVDFKNTVIIMTSNIASQYIYEMGDKPEDEIRDELMNALKQHFRPEFLNRLDDIIIFHRLTREHLVDIVKIELENLNKRMEEKNIRIAFTDKAVDQLVERGFDPQFGARPLKRVIRKEIENELAVSLLKGDVKLNHPLRIDFEDGEFKFKVES
jgi:ATP-dependent Clp protease ATP-binding subunit ClpB